jgi:hypothetical protein
VREFPRPLGARPLKLVGLLAQVLDSTGGVEKITKSLLFFGIA